MKVCRHDPYTDVDVSNFSESKKEFKQKAKKQRHDLRLKTASLFKMCEQSGHPECFWPVRNRIVRQLDDLKLSNDSDLLFVSPNHLSDLRLSDTGIEYFRETLLCYLEPSILDTVYAYITAIMRMNGLFSESCKQNPRRL